MTKIQKNKDTIEDDSTIVKSAVSCPISWEIMDERAVRTVAGMTVILLALYLIFGLIWIPLFLVIDFTMRSFISRKWAPLAVIARKIVCLMNPKNKKPINAGPKIFAAKIGVIFSMILFGLQLFGLESSIGSILVILMFTTAAFLESVFALCLGCHLYTFLQKLKLKIKIA